MNLPHRFRTLSDESKLCFAAAAGFFAIGGVGWLINRISPGSTVLGALLAVGSFYLLLGVLSLFKKPAPSHDRDEASPEAPSVRGEFSRDRESMAA